MKCYFVNIYLNTVFTCITIYFYVFLALPQEQLLINTQQESPSSGAEEEQQLNGMGTLVEWISVFLCQDYKQQEMMMMRWIEEKERTCYHINIMQMVPINECHVAWEEEMGNKTRTFGRYFISWPIFNLNSCSVSFGSVLGICIS